MVCQEVARFEAMLLCPECNVYLVSLKKFFDFP